MLCASSLIFFTYFQPAFCGDADGTEDNQSTRSAARSQNIYIDLSTAYATIPANAFSLGFRNFTFATSASSQNIFLDAPLTVDLSDSISIYGGVSASASQSDPSQWTPLTVYSWNVGFSADILEQSGLLPGVSVQSTFTKTTSGSSIAATGSSTVLEMDYALNEDQTEGVIAGVKYTAIFPDLNFVKIAPSYVGYVGAYYQWPSNWKLTGRAGIQSFGGAQIGPLQSKEFTQPIVRVNFDRMDDNDNTLFGISVDVAWTPKPIFQLTLSTPIYAVRN